MSNSYPYRTKDKFKHLLSRSRNESPKDVPMELIDDDRFVIKNEILLRTENVLEKPALVRLLNDMGYSISKEQIKRCCWDKKLLIVSDLQDYKSAIDTFKGQETLPFMSSYNELKYGDNHGPAEGDNQEGGSNSNEMVKEESTGIKYKRKKSVWRPKSCNELLNSVKPHDPNKIQIGIIDFGWGDPHTETLKSIIEDQSDLIQTHDYSTINSHPVATISAICCQIARGIKEKMDILNISLGHYSKTENKILSRYIQLAGQSGILIVCSAGNSDSDNDIVCHWPSNFAQVHHNVISISSSKYKPEGRDFEKTRYANYGKRTVDAFCNGAYLYPSNVNLVDNHHNDNNHHHTTEQRAKYGYGTSFSTAFISGIVARLFSEYNKSTFMNANGFDKEKIFEYLNFMVDGHVYSNNVLKYQNAKYLPRTTV